MTTVTLPSGAISMSDIYDGLKQSATTFNTTGGINSRPARTLANIRSGAIDMNSFRGKVVSGYMALGFSSPTYGANTTTPVQGGIAGTDFAPPANLISVLYSTVSGNTVIRIYTGGVAPSTSLVFSMSGPSSGYVSAALSGPVLSGGGNWDYTYAGDVLSLVSQNGLETFWRIS